MVQGVIIKALSGFYYVAAGDQIVECKARGRFRYDGCSPLVGDRVQLSFDAHGKGRIEAVEQRRNAFIRPAVANIDQLIMIGANVNPITDPFLIDRVVAIAENADCEPVVCLNKCDLDPADHLYAIYRSIGFRVLRTSAATGLGVDELRDALDACKINNSQENYQRLTATLAAAPLYFPAQRPDGAAAEADGQQHLQFGKVRTNDGRTFFCAFTDRARLLQWRNMGSVELGVKDYTSLVLSSNDTGIIIDPGVGSGLALTREMLQTLQAQTAFIDQMRAAANELGLNFDADAISEAARNINVDEPEKTERKERRWFGKKKK